MPGTVPTILLALSVHSGVGPPTCSDILRDAGTTGDAAVLEACVLEMTNEEDAWRLIERRLALPGAAGLAERLLDRGEQQSAYGRLRVLRRIGDASIAPELQRRAVSGQPWRAPYLYLLLELDPPRAFDVVATLKEQASRMTGVERASAMRALDRSLRVGADFIARADAGVVERLAEAWEPSADGWCDPTSDSRRDTRICDRPWTFLADLHARAPGLARRWMATGEPHQRVLALAALRSVPPDTVPDVPVELLSDDDAVVRLLALRALIRGRGCAGASAFRTALADSDPRVRGRAAAALARCGDDSVAPILAELAGSDACAAAALERLRPPDGESAGRAHHDRESAEAAARRAAEARELLRELGCD